MTEIETNEHATTATPTDELAAVLTEIVEETPKEKEKKRRITLLEDGLVMIDQREYRLVVNYREGFDIEKINERYSDVLNRYDYIVGDVGFEQLRLKGFFSDHQKKMPVEHRIGSLQDYLYEYCNFGCAYFVLEKVGASTKKEKPQSRNKRNNRRNKPGVPTKNMAYTQEKTGKPTEMSNTPKTKKEPVIKNRRELVKEKPTKAKPQRETADNLQQPKRNFTIRQKDE